jgi:hypothetical protein
MTKPASPRLPRTKDRALVDTLPELYVYEDTGCEVSASCLNCPLPQCKFDDPIWFQKYRQTFRDLSMLTAIEREGLTVEETAARFAVTVRTVFRAVRRCRDEAPGMARTALAA